MTSFIVREAVTSSTRTDIVTSSNSSPHGGLGAGFLSVTGTPTEWASDTDWAFDTDVVLIVVF